MRKWQLRYKSSSETSLRWFCTATTSSPDMKLFAFVLLVFFVALLGIEASPSKKKVQPKCDLVCTADYSPVCGGVPNDKSVKPKLFGNKCVLSKYNCENKSNLEELPADQCKNAGGVRLS